jgi:hypothetical protein
MRERHQALPSKCMISGHGYQWSWLSVVMAISGHGYENVDLKRKIS